MDPFGSLPYFQLIQGLSVSYMDCQFIREQDTMSNMSRVPLHRTYYLQCQVDRPGSRNPTQTKYGTLPVDLLQTLGGDYV
jgi:hypothetical protein